MRKWEDNQDPHANEAVISAQKVVWANKNTSDELYIFWLPPGIKMIIRINDGWPAFKTGLKTYVLKIWFFVDHFLMLSEISDFYLQGFLFCFSSFLFSDNLISGNDRRYSIYFPTWGGFMASHLPRGVFMAAIVISIISNHVFANCSYHS